MRYYEFARFYLYKWNLNVVFATPEGTPLHSWREYADRQMSLDELDSLWKRSLREKNLRVTILTGQYMRSLEKPMVVIDIDEPPVDTSEGKDKLMKQFAREGYLVVESPRGFHLHAFVDKNNDLPHIVRVVREKKQVGEGACLQPHTWTMPPSKRPYRDGFFTYRFVYPDGSKTASYRKFIEKPLEPVVTSISGFLSDLELLTQCIVKTYSPFTDATDSSVKIKEIDSETGLKKPLFADMREFLASSDSFILPRCIAWILVNFFESTGDTYSSTRTLASQIDPEELLVKVPHGKRFLVSASFTLFTSHVVSEVKFDEIIDVLRHAIEDFPSDEGQPITRKLKYLLLADKNGYVHPRYAGLGSMNLTQVLGDFCLNKCFYGRMCRGRNPWRYYRREFRKILLSQTLSSDEEI